MANSQGLNGVHATSSKMMVGEGDNEHRGNNRQLSGDSHGEGGSWNKPQLQAEVEYSQVAIGRKAERNGSYAVGAGGEDELLQRQVKEGEVGRNVLQGSRGSWGVEGGNKGQDGRGGSRGQVMEGCNSPWAAGKYKEDGVLPTLRVYKAIAGESHARETHAVSPPGGAPLQVPPRSGSGAATGLLKVGADDHFIHSTAAAAAAAAVSSAQPPPPPAASLCKLRSRITSLLQHCPVFRGGAAAPPPDPVFAADRQLSPPILSHMQTRHDGPAPSHNHKLPAAPPNSTSDDNKLKVLHLSPDDHCCLSKEGKSTFFQATLNCLSLLYGLGILSSPYAVAKAGWMGAIISILVSTAYAYTAHLMAKCVEYDPACSNYQDIAKLALGKKMRKVITAMFYMELTGTLVGYCISMGDNLDKIFPHISFTLPGLTNRNFMICVVSLIILPSVWLRDLSALSFTSIWCIASSVILLVAVLVAATVNHIGFHYPLPFLHIKGVPVAAGLYAFSYGGTSVFPSIYKSMEDPSKFTQVLTLSFFIATTSIGGLGIIGAYMFGDETRSQVTLSMPVHFITTKIVLWMTILTPIFKFALQLSPITTAVETKLYKHCKNTHSISNKTLLFVISTLMRSSVLALIVIISMILPYFENIIALVGSSMTIAICLIFPCLFYLKLYWKRLSFFTIGSVIFLISLGLIVGACGTIVAFQGLVNNKRGHSTS